MSYVYWLYDDTCIDPSKHGYVGVTDNWKKRVRTHKRKGRVPADARVKVLYEGYKNACFELERHLRPEKSIGWNSAAGGARGYVYGFSHSAETKERLKRAWTDERRAAAAELRQIEGPKLRGQKRPKQSEAMKGEKNPMFGKSEHTHGLRKRALEQRGKEAYNRQNHFCIWCHERVSHSTLKNSHSKCFKKFCEGIINV